MKKTIVQTEGQSMRWIFASSTINLGDADECLRKAYCWGWGVGGGELKREREHRSRAVPTGLGDSLSLPPLELNCKIEFKSRADRRRERQPPV